MPELLQVRFETEQGMVRPAARLLGVVSDAGPLGFAVDHQHHGVEVEHQAGARPGLHEQGMAELVVQPHELTDVAGRQALQEPPERCRIRKAVQPHNALERPVVLQDLRGVDAIQADDDGVEQGQQHLGGLVRPRPGRRPKTSLEKPLESEPLTKRVDQGHPGEVRQVSFLEGDRQISEAFRHGTKSYPRGRILSKSDRATDEVFSPSWNAILSLVPSERLTHH